MTKSPQTGLLDRAKKTVRRPFVLVSVAAAALFCFKATDIVTGLTGFTGVAIAAEDENEAPAEDVSAEITDAESALIEAPSTPMAVQDPAMMTQSELALLKDLSKRRNDLDARERDLDMRTRLLEATEKRVETKIADLKALESQVKGLLVEHESQENEKLGSLVKVYEKMKPADAARILEGLDMSIQMDVATRMSELRMAPVLAKMNAKAAQRLTTQLATKQTIDLNSGVN